jgi:hypothetical protein
VHAGVLFQHGIEVSPQRKSAPFDDISPSSIDLNPNGALMMHVSAHANPNDPVSGKLFLLHPAYAKAKGLIMIL